ncbi:MAG: exonuclease domain-containing protein [Actinomycetota bacterium]|nr:exonuclease domain-containing protein [Actinomycetota bacterium]
MRTRSPRTPGRGRLVEAAAYATAELPRRGTPWREAAWCALDFELTGLDHRRDEIISFGAIPIHDGRLQLRSAVYGLVRPECPMDEAAIRVHGLRAVDLERAPALADAIGPLLEAITGRVLVVHTAAVERAFLGRALRAHGLRLRGPIVDTEVLGRVWLHERHGQGGEGLSLGSLAASLGLPAERPHDALGDALTTAQVFIALATHFDARRPETVGGLTHAQRRLESIAAFNLGRLRG